MQTPIPKLHEVSRFFWPNRTSFKSRVLWNLIGQKNREKLRICSFGIRCWIWWAIHLSDFGDSNVSMLINLWNKIDVYIFSYNWHIFCMIFYIWKCTDWFNLINFYVSSFIRYLWFQTLKGFHSKKMFSWRQLEFSQIMS